MDITNALKELEENLRELPKLKIKCAYISYNTEYFILGEEEDNPDTINIKLPLDYTEEEYNKFKKQLDFNYDSGFGGQYLYGTIWMNDDKTWLERGEYDGSEWWNIKKLPEINKNLIKK